MEATVICLGTPNQALAAASGLVWFPVGQLAADPKSRPVPGRGELLQLRVQLKDCASSPTTLTAQIARTSAGAGQLTNRTVSAATQTLSFERTGGTTSSTRAVAVWPLSEQPFHHRPDDTAGTLYVGLLLDTGSAVIEELELYIRRTGAGQ